MDVATGGLGKGGLDPFVAGQLECAVVRLVDRRRAEPPARCVVTDAVRSRSWLAWTLLQACACTAVSQDEEGGIVRGSRSRATPITHVLTEPLQLPGGALPAGTQTSRSRDTGQLRSARLFEPVRIAGILWAKNMDVDLHADGTIRHAYALAADHEVGDGVTLAPGHVRIRPDGSIESLTGSVARFGDACRPCALQLFPNGKIRSFRPKEVLSIGDVTTVRGRAVVFREDGTLEAAVVAGGLRRNGTEPAPRTAVWFGRAGEIQSAFAAPADGSAPPEQCHDPRDGKPPIEIELPLRREYAGAPVEGVRVHDTGIEVALASEAVIDGIPCSAGTQPGDTVWFSFGFRLAVCRLARDIAIDGMIVREGSQLSFDRDGLPVSMLSRHPHTIEGETCDAGEVMFFDGRRETPSCGIVPMAQWRPSNSRSAPGSCAR